MAINYSQPRFFNNIAIHALSTRVRDTRGTEWVVQPLRGTCEFSKPSSAQDARLSIARGANGLLVSLTYGGI